MIYESPANFQVWGGITVMYAVLNYLYFVGISKLGELAVRRIFNWGL